MTSTTDLPSRPYNPEEDIDYDKERVIVTPHGARIVVPLEGVIKWQKRHYEREIGEFKAYVSELEDKNKLLEQQQKYYEDKINQLKNNIKLLRNEIKENPVYIEKTNELKEKNDYLLKENNRLIKLNKLLIGRLLSHGISATVYET